MNKTLEKYVTYGNPEFGKMLSLLGHDALIGNNLKAEGTKVWDSEGNEYLDLTAGISVHNIGHNHPKIRSAIKEFLEGNSVNVLQTGINSYHADLLEALAEITPGNLQRSFIDMRGADVVEAAIKTSRLYSNLENPVLWAGSEFKGFAI